MKEPVIQYPKRMSEFEVQALLWMELKKRCIDVRGCVPCRTIDGDKHPKCYLDLVVFSDLRTPMFIIECKNRPEPGSAILGARQRRRYSRFNIPLLVCDHDSKIPAIVQIVEAQMEEMA